MIISRTPFRISFFGGGTDYPAWYRQHGGAVLATSIDKYCYITCRHLPPFFNYKYRVVWSKNEMCNTIDEISHVGVRGILKHLKFERGLEVHHDGDLPARSGIGSSSAFTVGLLHALNALTGRMISKRELATESIHIEQEILHETVGSQDQVSTAFGGLNHIVFAPNGHISVKPITVSVERVDELCSHLMLFYTGIYRTASDIATNYVSDIESKTVQLKTLGSMVDESIEILNSSERIARFGKLLGEAWANKREIGSPITNARVDDIYSQACSSGALGGKLLGAGGGGFMLLFVEPTQQAKVREALSDLLHIPFMFESNGSQIIFFDPKENYDEAERDRSGREIADFREVGHMERVGGV